MIEEDSSPTEQTPSANLSLDARVNDIENKLGKRSHVVGFVAHVLTFAIAVLALVQSQRNNRLTEQANTIANEAFKASTNQFIQMNRPHLAVKLKKGTNGFFLTPALNGTSVVHVLDYEIKNIGNIGAKDVIFPSKLGLGPSVKVDPTNVSFKIPKP